jgi:hypothetical protein
MATGSQGRVSRMAVRGNGNPTRTGRCSSVPRNPAHTPSAAKHGNGGRDQHDAPIDINRYLKPIVALAIAAEVTLRSQNSEQDGDIADSLRHGIVNPLSVQIESMSQI